MRLVKSIVFSPTVDAASLANALMSSKKSLFEVTFAAFEARILALFKRSVLPVAADVASDATVLRLVKRFEVPVDPVASSASLLKLVISYVFPVAAAVSLEVCKARLDTAATSPFATP